MKHAGDFQVVALFAEEDAVILGTKPNQWRFYAPKLLCVPLPGLGLAGQRFEDLSSDRLFNAADVGFGLHGPDDALTHCLGVFLPVAALGPSCPNRPWSSRTPPELPRVESAGCV